MRYKILKGCKLFDRLIALQEKCQEANKAAFDFAKKLGSDEIVSDININNLAGGISGIKLNEKPQGWKLAAPKYYSNVYFPKNTKANKEILESIAYLPVVKNEELNKILNYNMWAREKNDKRVSFNPGVYWNSEDVIFVAVAEQVKYTPVEGMIEITVSEFNQLKKTS